MRRFNQNLSMAIAVVGITLFASAAFAHGFGGTGGGHVGGSTHPTAFAPRSTGRSLPGNTVHPTNRIQNFARINNPGTNLPPVLIPP
ncbi:MAG TPA: hypothetical protein VHX65_02080 [Pirellulales bacterium]|jgi:hypothetical protein|nr:hypothetical protein [Pirellulales bacterium]